MNKKFVFNETQRKQLANLSEVITANIKVEQVLCTGIRSIKFERWFALMEDSFIRQYEEPVYDLIILTSDDEKRNEAEIDGKIENFSQQLNCRTNLNIIKLSQFADMGGRSYLLYKPLLERSVVIYNAKAAHLSIVSDKPTEIELTNNLAIAYRHLKRAVFSGEKEWYVEAVFDLNRAFRYACLAANEAMQTGVSSDTDTLSLWSIVKHGLPGMQDGFMKHSHADQTLEKFLINEPSKQWFVMNLEGAADQFNNIYEIVNQLLIAVEHQYKSTQKGTAIVIPMIHDKGMYV